MGRATKSNNSSSGPLNSMGLEAGLLVGAPGVDPDYIMQLVNDARPFADVLPNLKKAFQCQGDCSTRVGDGTVRGDAVFVVC